MWCWIHPEKQRYYQAELVVDLFRDWTMVWAWGGLGTKRGSQRIKGMASREEGLRQIAGMDAHRKKRGYIPVETFANWRLQVEPMKRLVRLNKQQYKRSCGGQPPEPDLFA